jgi:hypothetical protein
MTTRSARTVAGMIACLAAPLAAWAALGDCPIVAFEPAANAFPLVVAGRPAALLVDSNDWPGVVRVVNDLQADVGRVCGAKPEIMSLPAASPTLVIVGTLGKSTFIDELAKDGRIDASPIRGRWESWLTQVVDHPFPGVERALVIAGSDKRGAIYGAYDLSEGIGVSPWYWWSDVPATHR